MFKGRNRSVKFRPQNGQQIVVKANVSVYEPRGDYQLLVDVMDMAGDGLLQQQFEQLKCDLAAQGLFSTEHKKALPTDIQRIGVITSPTGAAIHDVLTVLKRRNPLIEIIVYPTQVQGTQASLSLINAINRANNRNEVDVLILTRGGGSLEDLWCFNDEALAHNIFHSNLPIISAVGHEVDITIADFVSDYRAPTPSAAAEIASISNEQQHQKLQFLSQQLQHVMTNNMHQYRQRLLQLATRLKAQDPKYKLAQQAQLTDELQHQLTTLITAKLNHAQHRLNNLYQRLLRQSPQLIIPRHLDHNRQLSLRLKQAMTQLLASNTAKYQGLMRELNTVSPLATLERGFSISFDSKERVIKDIDQLSLGDTLITKLSNGDITSTITKLKKPQ